MMRLPAIGAKGNWCDQAAEELRGPSVAEISRISLVRTARLKWSNLSAAIMKEPGPPMTLSS
jgi:hypothetical protein